MPSVTMNGSRPKTTTKKPFVAPMITPDTTPAAIASQMFQPSLTLRRATTFAESISVEATERS